MAGKASSIEYRPEIDGLRAISVLLVVLFHAGVPGFAGGYIGVDVFYIISGYLITKLLVHELKTTDRIDLLAFWARRMRRILPAAVTVLCLSLIAANFILPPLEVTQAANDLMAAALYYANWRFAETAKNYFAQGRGSLYLNYWSLAIEEQFYALWPVLIVLAGWITNRLRRAPSAEIVVLPLAGGVLAASLLYCLWLSAQDASLAFYSTFSRAWELSLGALVAVARPSLARAAGTWLAAIGLIAISIVAVAIPTGTRYPGIVTLVPTVGAALVLAATSAGQLDGLVGRLLRLPAMVLTGKISYAWYLWHWPVFVLGKSYFVRATPWHDVFLIGLSFGLAFLTYVLIEKPIRFASPLVTSPRISVVSGAALSALAAVFALIAQTTFAKPIIVLSDGKRFDALDILDQRGQIYSDGCHLDLLETDHKPCAYGDIQSPRKAWLFGDSIAAAWFPAIHMAVKAQRWRLMSRTKSMCSPAVIEERAPQLGRYYEECSRWRQQILREASQEQPDIIFVAGASAPPLRQADLDGRAAEDAYVRGEDALVRQLLETTKAEIVFLRLPALGFNPVGCLLAHPRAEGACSAPLEKAAKLSPFPRGSHEGNPRIRVVDLGPEICPAGKCQAYQSGQIMMLDDVHLTPTFARTISAPFERILANH